MVVMAGVLTPVLGRIGGLDREALAGLFAGVSTNSPAFAAAQQMLTTLPGIDP
jgi:uncharacterized transporter YbjL